MRTKLTAATALAGSLMFATLGWGLSGPANAAPTPALKGDAGMLTLVARNGGGNGGGGGASVSGGGNGGGGASVSGGGGERSARVDGGDRGAMSEGRRGGDEGGRMARSDNDRGDRSRGDDNWKGKHAERDHHGDRDHHGNRHRVFRNGAWVWVYGPDYYASDDCSWLRHRAIVTGSPYWWDRYNACRY